MEFKEVEKLVERYGTESLSYWGNALAGETGEVCNLLKKHERDGTYPNSIGEELADVFIQLELIAQVYNIDLEAEILRKLGVVKERRIRRFREVKVTNIS